jgi:hypothetical protein
VQLRGITVDRLGSYTVKNTYINPTPPTATATSA